MRHNKKHPINNFYIGELYLYTTFEKFLSIDSSTIIGRDAIDYLKNSGAISFQKDLMNRYTDWKNKREYQGFLTIFYKQGDKYVCLHNGKAYQLNSSVFIENLIPLNELLPQINAKCIKFISVNDALELFDILFKKQKDESVLYEEKRELLTDFYVGDIALKERSLPEGIEFSGSAIEIEELEKKVEYFNLPQHIMLEKNNLEIYSFGQNGYANTVYRCLFLRDGVDLYNINDNSFYNHNEDKFDTIIPFKEYIKKHKMTFQDKALSIPKALKLFKKTI